MIRHLWPNIHSHLLIGSESGLESGSRTLRLSLYLLRSAKKFTYFIDFGARLFNTGTYIFLSMKCLALHCCLLDELNALDDAQTTALHSEG